MPHPAILSTQVLQKSATAGHNLWCTQSAGTMIQKCWDVGYFLRAEALLLLKCAYEMHHVILHSAHSFVLCCSLMQTSFTSGHAAGGYPSSVSVDVLRQAKERGVRLFSSAYSSVLKGVRTRVLSNLESKEDVKSCVRAIIGLEEASPPRITTVTAAMRAMDAAGLYEDAVELHASQMMPHLNDGFKPDATYATVALSCMLRLGMRSVALQTASELWTSGVEFGAFCPDDGVVAHHIWGHAHREHRIVHRKRVGWVFGGGDRGCERTVVCGSGAVSLGL